MYFKGIPPTDAARRDVSSPIVVMGIVLSFRTKGVSGGRKDEKKAELRSGWTQSANEESLDTGRGTSKF